jgi:hypothetical protein
MLLEEVVKSKQRHNCIQSIERENKMKSMGIGSVIMNVFTFASGLVAIFWGVYGIQLDTSNWLGVEGQVVSSSGSMSDAGSEYSTYEYTVDGAKYTGSSHAGYDVGKKITVYYDPADPSVSDDNPGSYVFLGFISFIFGLLVVGGYAWRLVKAAWAAKQKDMA